MAYKLPKQVQELVDELYAGANLTNKKRIDELVRTMYSAMIPAVQGGVMKVESMVASNTKNPIVVFSWNENRGELTPIQARGYAMQILEACEGAVQDAALYLTAVSDLKLDDNTAFGLISGVRKNRRQFEDVE